MLEFLEAPLSFFVGCPSAIMKYCDKNVLSEIVVVNLDDISASTDYEGRYVYLSFNCVNAIELVYIYFDSKCCLTR